MTISASISALPWTMYRGSNKLCQLSDRLRSALGHRWVDRANRNTFRPQTYTHPDELLQLVELALAAPPNTLFVEIGSYLGASARYLGAAARLRNTKLICIDTWNNETMPDGIRDTWIDFEQNTAGVSKHIVPLRKNSSDLTAADISGKIGLAFIDGDHSYRYASQDVNVIEPLMAHRGIIVFHDATSFSGVGRALGDLLTTKRWQLGGIRRSLAWVHSADWAHDL